MSTTISSINESLVDQKVVAALRYILPMFRSFSYAVEMNGKIKDDTMYVPIATDPTAGVKTLGTMKAADGTIAGVSVSLANPLAAGWDATEGNIAGNLFANYWADKAAGAVYAVAKGVIDAALGVVTKAHFGDGQGTDKLIVAPADFGQEDLGLLWKLGAKKIKQREISLGLNASYAASLIGNAAIANIFSSNGTNFLQSGILPQLIGMNTWAYPAFPANSESLGGALFGRAAIVVAVAPISPLAAAGEGNIVDRRIITEPDSGISCLYTVTVDGGGLVWGEVAVLYGVDKGHDACVRLVEA